MAFAMTFFVLMPRDAGFKTIPLALVTSFAMMVGEVDYRDTFIDEQNRPKNFALIIVFVVISLIVMTILLMNLLTGLAVGDTGEILKRSMAEKRIQQVDFNHPKFIM